MGGERWKRWMRERGVLDRLEVYGLEKPDFTEISNSSDDHFRKYNMLLLNFLSFFCRWQLRFICDRNFLSNILDTMLSRVWFSFEKDVHEGNQSIASSATSSCSKFSSKRVITSW
jgi:hypothetical protein